MGISDLVSSMRMEGFMPEMYVDVFEFVMFCWFFIGILTEYSC